VVWVNTQFATVRILCLTFIGFLVTRIGGTSGPILMIYTSYEVFPHKDVPFWCSVDTAS